MADGYLPRTADIQVREALTCSGGVLIKGVRACGKTSTGRVHAASEVDLDSDLPAVRTAVRTSPKLHFVDPALAAAAIGASPERLLRDLETAGQWFESQVVQHLRVFSEPLGGRIFHYRDKSGREADAVIELPDGRWGLIEVKLGQRQIPAAQASLAAVAEVIDPARTGTPTFQAIVTADGPTLTLDPEAHVVTFPLRGLVR